MKNILMIEVSPRGKDSASRAVSDTLAERLAGLYPGAKVLRRDLTVEQLPHLDGITLRAISTKDLVEAESLKESAHQSDQLTAELLKSDLLVMATPMWNFGIPSALKAWIDLVVRPGRTFQYSDEGVLGLAKNKKAILILASGGVFTEGPWRSWDFVEPYLRQILAFHRYRGCTDSSSRGHESPCLAATAVLKANQAVEELSL